ncbi:MAG: sigma-70 family RNA polymerase sigma factor [Candidatus Omnitrophica bacterium]|nr:sigma-70 family RNA polymerase sigma factor [Candidatus Omnitrophota bacterium]
MNEVPADIKALLDEHDWDDTIPRLIKYAFTKIRQMSWYQQQGGQVAAGKMAEDFVMDAILKVYRGQRQWDPQTVPDLLVYLFGVVRSEIHHHSQSLENRCLRFLETLSDQHRKDAEAIDTSDAPEGFMEGFLKEIEDEPRLVRVATLAAAGRKPREIAEELRLPVTSIYNTRKLLQRRLEEYLARRQDAS